VGRGTGATSKESRNLSCLGWKLPECGGIPESQYCTGRGGGGKAIYTWERTLGRGNHPITGQLEISTKKKLKGRKKMNFSGLTSGGEIKQENSSKYS